ncbi:MAG TPA: hypothetical protein VFQ05_11425 [Candidatus Eisenbacteria bacterium]|nr:hypothetical protein [Candidatus Eisenbacteria bacterium]
MDAHGRDPEIERLRAQIRGLWGVIVALWLVLAIGFVALFAWLPRTPGPRARNDTIAARRFVVEDELGRVRLDLGVDETGVAGIWLGPHDQRQPGASLVEAGATAQLSVRSETGGTVVIGPQVIMLNASGRGVSSLGILSHDTSYFQLSGPTPIFYPRSAAVLRDSLLRIRPR